MRLNYINHHFIILSWMNTILVVQNFYVMVEVNKMKKMKLINDTLSMSFLAVIAMSSIVFPIIAIVDNHNMKKKMIKTIENKY